MHSLPLLVLASVLLMGGIDTWGAALIAVPVVVYLVFLFWVCVKSSAAGHKPSANWFFYNAVVSCAFIAVAYALGGAYRLSALTWCVPLVWSSAALLGRRKTMVLVLLCIALPLHGHLIHALCTSQPVHWAGEFLTSVTLAWLLFIAALASEQHLALKTHYERANTHLRQRFSGLLQKSMMDHLTGAFNRTHIKRVLYAEAARSRRTRRPFALCMIDLDNFKKVNDQYGHQVGDQVLVGFCDVAKKILGESRIDIIARWGGEEFIIVLPETSQAEALSKILRLREAVHAYSWHAIAQNLSVTFSAGLAMYQGGEVDDLIKMADMGMYEAKSAGRDRVYFNGIFYVAATADVDATRLNAATSRGPSLSNANPPSAKIRTYVRYPSQKTDQTADIDHSEPQLGQEGGFAVRAWIGVMAVIKRVAVSPRPEPLAIQLCAAAYLFALLMLCVSHINAISPVAIGVLTLHVCIGFLSQIVLLAVARHIRRSLNRLVFWQICWGAAGMSLAVVLLPLGAQHLILAFCAFPIFSVFSAKPSDVTKSLATVVIALCAALFYQNLLFDGADEAHQKVLMLQGLSSVLSMAVIGSRSIISSEAWQRISNERDKILKVSEELADAISRDGLTGVMTRQFMQSHLESEIERHARNGIGFWVIMLDIDHFKAINDAHGHSVGDEVLNGFAQRIKSVVRSTDIVCRWGGEEFLVCLSDVADLGGVSIVIDRMFAAVSDGGLCKSKPELKVTFSAGLALHAAGESIVSMVSRADQALYLAKAAGRDSYVFADGSMPFCVESAGLISLKPG
jgi:diguanylate cyclase (GGDEF)-like protein